MRANDTVVPLGLPRAAPEIEGMSVERLARIPTVMQQFIDNKQVPGFLTVVARHGKIVHFETQGYADVENEEPIKPDTLFRIYSMTKPITAVAVMMLFEEGYFLLDDPISRFLPEFQEMKVYVEGALVEAESPITIRQLLLHTAGLDYGFYPDDPVARQFREVGLNDADARTSGMSTADYVRTLASMPLYTQPGVQWRYSDAMAVLGRLVEVLSGRLYGEFLADRLFHPLGMFDTDFYVPPEKLHRLARLYEIGPEDVIVASESLAAADYSVRSVQGSDFSRRPSFESGGAGLVGTAADYLRFAQMLLNGGELDGSRILSPTTVDLILANHLGPEFGEMPLASLDSPGTRKKGLGAGFCGAVVTNAINAGGGSNGLYAWGGAANTSFWIDPQQNLVGLLMTQSVSNKPLCTDLKMMQIVYQAIVRR